jgi:Domain of unknown function (DUF1834)
MTRGGFKCGFKFRLRGIEAGMCAALKDEIGADKSGGYVRKIVTYKGQLSSRGLRDLVLALLKSLAPQPSQCPLMLVCYTEGADKQVDASGNLDGEPITVEHVAAFVVIVIDTDARGDQAQREGTQVHPGLYEMLDDVREILTGLQFVTDDEEQFAFNETPLIPAGVECIDRLPAISAYAQHFTTSWYWISRERRAAPVPIETINFGIDPLNSTAVDGGVLAPGVHAASQP